MRFNDKTVLVTGSSRGIGKAIALLFARAGANLVIDYYVSSFEPDADENAKKVVEKIEEIGRKAIAVNCDVREEKQVINMMKRAAERFGKIDVLVNNAGVVYDVGLSKKSVKEWKETLDTNLLGTFLCSKNVVPYMKKGKIINISSTNSINSFNSESMDYDSSKAGINILTRNLAKELAPNILVNSVAPGWVNTEMNKNLPRGFVKEETDKIYLKRFAEPEEIAKAVLFLASSDADYINGITLMIDGGYG